MRCFFRKSLALPRELTYLKTFMDKVPILEGKKTFKGQGKVSLQGKYGSLNP